MHLTEVSTGDAASAAWLVPEPVEKVLDKLNAGRALGVLVSFEFSSGETLWLNPDMVTSVRDYRR